MKLISEVIAELAALRDETYQADMPVLLADGTTPTFTIADHPDVPGGHIVAIGSSNT